MLTRRQFVAGAASVTGGVALAGTSALSGYSRGLGPPPEFVPGRTVAVRLNTAERSIALPCFGGHSLPMWTFLDGRWPPVIRLNLGDRLETRLENRLSREAEYTSIHWHGIRLPNNQDGVPYLVQQPVLPGKSFEYGFTPPDAGTFFFHTHCNTVEQLGRGLLGALIIDGDTTEPYDTDTVLVLRDWYVDLEAGEFNSFFTLRGAARAGTYGTVRSTNGVVNPTISLPASGDCRVRLINADATRIMRIGVEGAEAAIVAIDGNAVRPFPLSSWLMGPAMRIDLVLRAPREGGVARLLDRFASRRIELASFVGKGTARRAAAFDPAPLRAPRIPRPDLKSAKRLSFAFQATDAGQVLTTPDGPPGGLLGPLCLSSKTFWTINGQPWPSRDHERLPPPLAILDRGRTYIFVLKNDSRFSHPIHIHGHTFKLLRASKQSVPTHHTDTILLLPDEEAEVAFVADNPGDWMFHCHIIEHQESGMMAYLRVT
jgi:FtsP/CotA-like multicopper oxidase with cupredoxin domain